MPTPTPEPQLPVVETPTIAPSGITMNKIDDAIDNLRHETDYKVFNDRLDELAGQIESYGLMEQYDSQLNELADLLTELLKKAA